MKKAQFNMNNCVRHLNVICSNTKKAGATEEWGFGRPGYLIAPAVPPRRLYKMSQFLETEERLVVSGEGCSSLESYMAELRLGNDIGDLVSDSAVGIACTAVIADLWRTGFSDDLARTLTQQATQNLRSSIHIFTAFVGVENLSIRGHDELKVAQVALYTPDHARTRITELSPAYFDLRDSADFRTKWNQLGDGSAAPVSPLVQLLRGIQPSQFPGGAVSCVAEVVVRCDTDLLPSFAEKKVEEALDLIRCMMLIGLFSRERFGLAGSVARGTRLIVYTRPGTENADETSRPMGNGVASLSPELFEYNRILEQHGGAFAFDELSDVLAKEDTKRTPLERSIVIAIRWLARVHKSDSIEDGVIAVAIALETLLLGGERGEKAETLANRVVVLVGRETIEMRLKMFESVKNFYTLRSQIVHGSATPDQLQRVPLTGIALSVLSAMAKRRREWKTGEEFAAWVKREMLAPRVSETAS